MDNVRIDQMAYRKYLSRFNELFIKVFRLCKIDNKDKFVEVSFVTKNEIKKLNLRYRGLDKETDVLSFGMEDDKFPGEKLIGEIVICPEVCERQAVEHDMSTNDEIDFLFVHGLLHVMGFDHETESDFDEMFELNFSVIGDERWRKIIEGYRAEYFQ